MCGLGLYYVKSEHLLCVDGCLSSRQNLVRLVSSFKNSRLSPIALARFARGPAWPGLAWPSSVKL